jgi:predicted Co/Zn/Cd cation transporter (cation efflux family)
MVHKWEGARSWLCICVLGVVTFSRHQKKDEMGSWLVPPIVIPILIVIMVAVYALYRAYS